MQTVVHTLLLILVLLSTTLNTRQGPDSTKRETRPLAFEGAQGFGRFTEGGRGGRLYEVTTLLDNTEPGSLRHALQQRHPRVVRFRVSGVIRLQSPLEITSDRLTLEGQSSPRGIAITGAPVQIKANQIIIRHLRFRLGTSGYVGDSLEAQNCKSIIIDHCSFSWSVDETASFYNNENFTLQYSLIANSLNRSIHPKGNHGYGGIWGGKNASFIKNILANHYNRTPRINGHRMEPGYLVQDELVEVANNLIFNWSKGNVYGAEDGKLDLVNNYYLPGPDTGSHRFIQIYPSLQGYSKLHLSGNLFHGRPQWSRQNWSGLVLSPGARQPDRRLVRQVKEERNLVPASELPRDLVSKRSAGANLTAEGTFLDSIDRRVYEQLDNALQGELGDSTALIDHEFQQIDSWTDYQSEFTDLGPNSR